MHLAVWSEGNDDNKTLQLAYLIRHPMQPIHAVHAGPEALLFGIDQVITAMDVNNV